MIIFKINFIFAFILCHINLYFTKIPQFIKFTQYLDKFYDLFVEELAFIFKII